MMCEAKAENNGAYTELQAKDVFKQGFSQPTHNFTNSFLRYIHHKTNQNPKTCAKANRREPL